MYKDKIAVNVTIIRTNSVTKVKVSITDLVLNPSRCNIITVRINKNQNP